MSNTNVVYIDFKGSSNEAVSEAMSLVYELLAQKKITRGLNSTQPNTITIQLAPKVCNECGKERTRK